LQALNVLKLDSHDEKTSQDFLKVILKQMEKIDYQDTPAVNSNFIYHTYSQFTGLKDPYLDIKASNNTAALKIYPELEEMVENSPDPMYTSARAAVAGNEIDFGIHLSGKKIPDLKVIIEEIKNKPLSHDDFPTFAKDLKNSHKVLYLADNAGEIVFDKLFISQIIKSGKEVVLVVKSAPILNDATADDVKQVGLDKLVKVVGTGNNCIGVNFNQISQELLDELEDSDIIISKGQANFESLDEIKGRKIFFLLKAKCEIIARELGVNYLDVVFEKSGFYQ
jgi:uncharacterized protein with ATP-grasp and redox domains